MSITTYAQNHKLSNKRKIFKFLLWGWIWVVKVKI